MNPAEYIIELKSGGHELAIHLLWREYPDATNEWDRDALNTEIRFKTPYMHGKVPVTLWSTELVTLQKIFQELQLKIGEDLRENYSLIEDALRLNIHLSRLGKLSITVEVIMDHTTNEHTSFTLDLDQSYLPSIINSIESALEKFPVHIEE